MNRRFALTASIAALAVLPVFSACTINTSPISTSPVKASPETPATTAAQPAEQPATADATTEASATAEASTTDAGTTDATTDASAGSAAEATPEASTAGEATDNSGTTGAADSANESEAGGESVNVPAGSGLKRLDVIKIYGAPASGGEYGRITAVFKAETDQPVMLNLRITLHDKNGTQIAENTGLNSVYTVGPQYVVTTNLIKLPAGKTPAKFKAQLIEVTPMSTDFVITKMPMPTLGNAGGTQILKGSIMAKGNPGKTSAEVQGACVMPDGTIYQGSDNISDQQLSGGSLDYEVKMYDAKGADLSKAKCYTSA